MIDKEKYLLICKCCDNLLNNQNLTIQRISISWLHVIREHPIILNRYEVLFSKNTFSKYFSRIKGISVNFFRFFLNIVNSIKEKPYFYELGHYNEGEHVDYLFVSHLIDPGHINNEFDFYFGNTIKNIDSLKYKTVTVLLNQTDTSNIVLKGNYFLSSRKILFCKLLDFKTEIKLVLQLIKESRLLRAELGSNNSFQDKVTKEAASQCLSISTANNLRYYFQFKKVISKYKPKNIISTFEGHAWERLLFCAAKEHSWPIKCMGYQHTSLFRLQHSVFKKMKPLYNPDVILTAGEAAFNKFKVSELGSDKIVAILGSNRGDSLIKKNSIISEFKNTCIVIPEGFDSECLILFNFALECSKAVPEVNFIFKMHPIMNRASFIERFPEFSFLPNNVKWASNDIDFDFSQCKWALYRGTTMIVQAIFAGLIPLYYQSKEDELGLDLLYEISHIKPFLTCAKDFLDTINQNNKSIYDSKLAWNYCSTLYNKFNYKALIDVSNFPN